MTDSEETILNGNEEILTMLGYKYVVRRMYIDVGEYDCDNQEVDVYFKIPPGIKYYDGQPIFQWLPNPDYGKTNPERWNSDIKQLDWNVINWGQCTYQPSFASNWDKLIELVDFIGKSCEYSMGYDTKDGVNMYYCWIGPKAMPEKIYTQTPNSLQEAIWLACVQYAKLSNDGAKLTEVTEDVLDKLT